MAFVKKAHRRDKSNDASVAPDVSKFLDGSRGDQFTFGIGTTTASPYSFFSSSVLLMWNDSAVPSGKRPLRTSSRYFAIASRITCAVFAYLRTNFGVWP